MVVVQPQRRVRLGFLLVPVLGCCLCIGAKAAEQELPPQKASDRATEIKELLKERHDTLSKVVDLLTAQYMSGMVEFARVAQAERDFLLATVDLADSPKERLAALKVARHKANQIAHFAETRFAAGAGTEAEVLQAKAGLLDARIELLREELKSQPGK